MDGIKFIFIYFSLILSFIVQGQEIGNYVNNGSFELTLPSLTMSPFDAVQFWEALDSANQTATFLRSKALGTVPNNLTGYQNARSGGNYILTTFFDNSNGPIWYPRNRLKKNLLNGVTYCAKYYVVNTNNNRIAIDSYGMYFGNSSLDTITKCSVPLTYLSPQVQFTSGIITDTLNWISISGTFTAVGDEKYLVLGNFKSPAITNTLLINTPTLQTMTNDIYIDDVSLIEMDLPAYAGLDTYVVQGDSAYLGRESDVEIDESCIWYQMTSPTTSITIDTIAGIWVKPVATATYVVRQQLWCSGVKWDTVVVSLSGVGVAELETIQNDIILLPNPATDFIQVYYSLDISNEFEEISIFNQLGQLIREEQIKFKDKKAVIPISEFESGVYFMELKNSSELAIRKRFVVSR